MQTGLVTLVYLYILGIFIVAVDCVMPDMIIYGLVLYDNMELHITFNTEMIFGLVAFLKLGSQEIFFGKEL